MHRMKPWNDNVQFQRHFLFAELKEWEASKSLNKATPVTTRTSSENLAFACLDYFKPFSSQDL